VFLFGFLAVLVLVVFLLVGLLMRSLGVVAGRVDGIGRLGGRGHGFGEILGMRFGCVSFVGLGLVRLGCCLGRDHGLGTDGSDRRRRLAGMTLVVMIVLAVMTMVVIVMMIVLVGMVMVVVPMSFMVMIVMILIVMIVTFVLAVMLGIGVQMLTLVRRALGVQDLALDRLGGGIGTFDDIAADALAVTAAAGIAVA